MDAEEYFKSNDIPNGWWVPTNVYEYAETQESAKGYLYRAYFNWLQKNKTFETNIKKAFELGGPNYGLAHYLMTYYYIDVDENSDKVIVHGLKALNLDISNEYKINIKDNLRIAYHRLKNYYQVCNYHMEDMNNYVILNDDFDKLSGDQWLSLYREHKDKFQSIDCLKVMNNILQRMEEIQKENETLRHFPGGPEYQAAMERFDSLKN